KRPRLPRQPRLRRRPSATPTDLYSDSEMEVTQLNHAKVSSLQDIGDHCSPGTLIEDTTGYSSLPMARLNHWYTCIRLEDVVYIEVESCPFSTWPVMTAA